MAPFFFHTKNAPILQLIRRRHVMRPTRSRSVTSSRFCAGSEARRASQYGLCGSEICATSAAGSRMCRA
eukprot:3020377-Lingulodinium_polyedra.AAC.1